MGTRRPLLNSEEYDFEPCYDFGNTATYFMSVTPYRRIDSKVPYEFLVFISELEGYEVVLVKDFPSLVMLLKDLAPLLHLAMEQELFKMREEEHNWKAKEAYKRGFIAANDCAHIALNRL